LLPGDRHDDLPSRGATACSGQWANGRKSPARCRAARSRFHRPWSMDATAQRDTARRDRARALRAPARSHSASGAPAPRSGAPEWPGGTKRTRLESAGVPEHHGMRRIRGRLHEISGLGLQLRGRSASSSPFAESPITPPLPRESPAPCSKPAPYPSSAPSIRLSQGRRMHCPAQVLGIDDSIC
jgi:hypothetical protein